ncbi:MAG: tetratricopeptide repeat protein [Fimbriimonas sp.]
MSVDVLGLWNFGDPELSERRFRAALEGAEGDDRLVLLTQIARSYGLRRDFEGARAVLSEVEAELSSSGPEPKARYWLELGRTYCSAAHTPETQTSDAIELARGAYTRAFEIAQAARLDYLSIDALHMMTMVDTGAESQIEWNRRALSYMERSDQAEAKKWEGSLRNNLGYALHLAGRYDEALVEFEKALALRISSGNVGGTRVGKWMIAWTLRAMGRYQEALEMQLALDEEYEEAGESDPYVRAELEHLYRALGDEERAESYASKA